ncbi:MAG: hypothetical protein B7X08_04200 [Acidocella sp. 20-63-7]|nr:MAG: hypothetical protein B7X08_04200 [Acidocella sp. 20-63-7]HQT46062.1 FUSC family protein [Acidocella sp.]
MSATFFPARWQLGVHEFNFAVKTTTGALLALAIAFGLGLESPYWVIPTSFIVAQPFTGAMRAKGVYRLCGTLLGGMTAVALVPNLVDAPVLLSLALALWVGGCLYVALLDRSARSYLFMLAGYSAGIIGFQALAHPQAIFDIALARVEEISLGIACTTAVGSLFFPRSLGPMLTTRMSAWAIPAQDWAIQALAGNESAALHIQRTRLAGDAVAIGMLIPHLSYESAHWQVMAKPVAQLRQSVLSLIPILSAVGDRVAQLKALDGMTPPLQTLLDDTAAWVQAGQSAANTATAPLQHEISTLERTECGADWASLLRASLLARLRELVGLVHYERQLRRHIAEGTPAPEAHATYLAGLAAPVKVRDHGLALLSALGAALTLLLLCAFWIGTGWPSGGNAAVMAAVACSFYAALDDPAAAMRNMLRQSVLAVGFGLLFIFVLLPRVEDFTALVLVMAPYLLASGILAARPSTTSLGMTLGVISTTQIGLQNTYQGNFVAFINGALALLLGIASAMVMTRLIRLAGIDWITRRQMRATWADIAATTERPQERAYFTGKLLDRLGLLLPRMAQAAPETGLIITGMLRDLRNGLNAQALQRDTASLPAAAKPLIARVLRRMARHYRGDPLRPAVPALRAALDSAIAALAGAERTPRVREALMSLIGLRYAFFPEATPPVALLHSAMEPAQ